MAKKGKEVKGERMVTFNEIREAFVEAQAYCKFRGLYWRDHMQPIRRNGQIRGYYILDETLSTAIKTIRI